MICLAIEGLLECATLGEPDTELLLLSSVECHLPVSPAEGSARSVASSGHFLEKSVYVVGFFNARFVFSRGSSNPSSVFILTVYRWYRAVNSFLKSELKSRRAVNSFLKFRNLPAEKIFGTRLLPRFICSGLEREQLVAVLWNRTLRNWQTGRLVNAPSGGNRGGESAAGYPSHGLRHPMI